MHDGSQKTLEEVVEWYDKGGHKNDWLSDKMKPLKLTDQEKKDLVAFMKEGLAGAFPKVEQGKLPVGEFTALAATTAKEKGNKAKSEEMAKAEETKAEMPKAEETQPEAKPEMKEAAAAAPAAVEEADKPRGFFGVTCDAKNQDVCTIKRVLDGSAAAEAGIKSGDVILAINGKETGPFTALQAAIGDLGAGDELTIKYKRDGKEMETKATLKGLPK